jgi:hypothetical protein
VGAAAYLVEWMRLYLRKLVLHVIRIHGANLLAGRRAQNLDNLDKLVNAGFARKERLTEHELSHDTSSRPHI